MKPHRLSGRKRCDVVLRKGKRFDGKTLRIFWIPGAPKHPDIEPFIKNLYMGTFASSKLDKSAVKRNRMRRRVREAVRLKLKDYNEIGPVQLLLTPKKASLSCDFAEIKSDVDSFFSLLT